VARNGVYVYVYVDVDVDVDVNVDVSPRKNPGHTQSGCIRPPLK
jgi:hypothetical protein